jgi:uncharacterized protein (TIGR02266 family)
MPDERRKALRAHIPSVRVIFESTTGERVEAELLDVSKSGLFIRTAKPLAIGKRLSLEVQAVADVAAWSALGRVVWTRETGETDARGMGVKLIDVDDAVGEAIDRLVRARQAAQASPAQKPPRPAAPVVPGAVARVVVASAPARERTVLGLAPSGAPVAAAPLPRERPPVDVDAEDPHEAPTKETVVPQRIVVLAADPAQVPPPEPAPPIPPPEAALPPAPLEAVPPLAPPEAAPPLAPPVEPAPPPAERAFPPPVAPAHPTAAAAPVPSFASDPLVPPPGPDGPPLRAMHASVQVSPPTPARPRRAGRWVLAFLLVVVLAAAALYVMRGRIPWVQRVVSKVQGIVMKGR